MVNFLAVNKKVLLGVLNFVVIFIAWALSDFSSNSFQFISYSTVEYLGFNLGVDGISIYFVLLTAIIIPVALLSNWYSVKKKIQTYVWIILTLNWLLLGVFLVLDIFLFYIFFESILPPLFLLIGLYGSDNRVRASLYLFLYTFNLKCERTQHTGSLKALVTKVIRETLLPAWLMLQGMVTSLVFIFEKLLSPLPLGEVVDMWVIAVLSHSCF